MNEHTAAQVLALEAFETRGRDGPLWTAQDRDWATRVARDSGAMAGPAFIAERARVAWQRHHAHGLAYAVWHQTRVLARLRQPEAAAHLLGFAQAYWRQHIGILSPASEKHVRRMRALVAAQAGATKARQWEAQGATLTPMQAIAQAACVAAAVTGAGVTQHW